MDVGDIEEKLFDVDIKVGDYEFDVNTEDGNEEPWYRVWGTINGSENYKEKTWNYGEQIGNWGITVISRDDLQHDATFDFEWEFREDDGNGYWVVSDSDDILYSYYNRGGEIPHSTKYYTAGYDNGSDDMLWLDYSIVVNSHWDKTSDKYETFYDYTYNWESVYNPVYDTRLQTSWQWVSQAQDIYDGRPRYETYDITVEVPSIEYRNNYITEEITEQQTVWVTERSEPTDAKPFGEFAGNSIEAGNGIIIDAVGDVNIVGQVRTTNNGTININTDADVIIEGSLPQGANANDTIAAPSVISTQNTLTITGNK